LRTSIVRARSAISPPYSDRALILLERRRERGLELCGIEGATATVVLFEAQSADKSWVY
jgi:hypothetical protein